MSQKLLIQCPNCNARLALPNSSQSEFAVGCPKCQLQFRVQNPAPLPANQPVNPSDKLERLEPVEESSSTSEQTTAASGNTPAPQVPAPIVQAETAKPARLVRAVPVDDGNSQTPSPNPAAPSAFQQPHVGATQLPIDSKGNFKGSVTKRDLPNFDFEATNAKFELHANAPGSKSNTVGETEQKAEASTKPEPQGKQPAEQPTEPVAEPPAESAQRESQPAHQVAKQEKQGTEPVSSDAKQESKAAAATSDSVDSAKGSPASLTANANPAPQKVASQPAKDRSKPTPDAVPDAKATDDFPVAEESAELELTRGTESAPGPADEHTEVAETQPDVVDSSSAPIEPVERLEPAPEPAQEEAARAQIEASRTETASVSSAESVGQTHNASVGEPEKDKLAELAAFVSKDDGTGRKGRRGKRGRRKKKKSAQVAKPSNAEARTLAAAENKAAAKNSAQPVPQQSSENLGPKASPRSELKPTPRVKPQAEARGPEPAKEIQAQSQGVASEKASAINAEVSAPKEKPATGTYSEQKSRKRLKKKPVKKSGSAAKNTMGAAKKDKRSASSAKAKKKEQEARREPEQSSEQDWTSYHYLANRSNTSRKKRKAIVAGAVSFLALCFAIWAVIKADLFKELSRPDSSDSGNEVAVETPVDSSHPFVNLYIKILQARIESLEQLSPTAEAMISYRQKNPVAGDIEYLLEKAVAEEPAPREARKLILSDLSKLENEQEKLEADLLKKMSKAERRKWDKWLRTDSTEPKELVAELQLCFKSYRSDGLFSLPVPAQDEEALWLSLEETQVVRNCLKSLVEVESGQTANLAGTRLFKEADALFANAIKRTEAEKSSAEVPQSYKEFLFAAKMARNAVVNRLEREQFLTPTLKASLARLDAAHEAFRLAEIGKSEAEVRAAFPNPASSVANAP